jgi:hypothetical protein
MISNEKSLTYELADLVESYYFNIKFYLHLKRRLGVLGNTVSIGGRG